MFHDVMLVDMTGMFGPGGDGGYEQPAAIVAHFSVDGDNMTTDRPRVDAAGLQAPVSLTSSREMLVLWVKHYT